MVPGTAFSETSITISGKTNPEYGTINKYTIEVKGELFNNGKSNIQIYPKSEKPGADVIPIVLREGSNSFTLPLVEDKIMMYDDYMYFRNYDIGIPHILQVTNHLTVATFEFTPQLKAEPEYTISEESVEKLQTKSARVVNWYEAKMENRWFMNIEVCSGQDDLQKPTIVIKSDIETTPFTLDKSINSLSCGREQIQVKAIDPKSVSVGLERIDLVSSSSNSVSNSEVEELKAEIADLKKQLETKDAILMEQLKVIQQLASSLKQTIFEPISYYFGFA